MFVSAERAWKIIFVSGKYLLVQSVCDKLYLRVQSVRDKLSLCVTNIYECRACVENYLCEWQIFISAERAWEIIFVSGKYLLVQSVRIWRTHRNYLCEWQIFISTERV